MVTKMMIAIRTATKLKTPART